MFTWLHLDLVHSQVVTLEGSVGSLLVLVLPLRHLPLQPLQVEVVQL